MRRRTAHDLGCSALGASPAGPSSARRLLVGLTTVAAAATLLVAGLGGVAVADPYGPDVASYQHPHGAAIEWSQVADEPDQHFAIIKATESTDYTNPFMASDAREAKAAGLTIGFYHFADPGASAVAQADFFAKTIGPVTVNELPPILDLEVTGTCGSAACSAAHIVAWTKSFLTRLKSDTGRTPMIYTDPGFWNSSVRSSAFGSYPLWLADYTFDPFESPTAMPDGWSTYALWQYTDNASIPGIQGETDRSTAASPSELSRLSDADANAYLVTALLHAISGTSLSLSQSAALVAELDKDKVTRQHAVSSLLNSTGHLHSVVEGLYKSVVDRTADSKGLAAYTSLVEHGSTVADVEAGLIGSQVFYTEAGSTTWGFINAAYEVALGRAADPNGMASWSNLMEHGMSRQTVALDLLTSQEGVTRLAATTLTSVFGVLPTSAQLASGVKELSAVNDSLLAYDVTLYTSGRFLDQAEGVS